MQNNLSYLVLFLILNISMGGCFEDKHDEVLRSNQYDLTQPAILILNDALMEISGISYYPKDTSVFAISDETGNLFKININTNVTQEWKFSKPLDFEDIILVDSTFYVLESNGNVHTLQFSSTGDTVYTDKAEFTGKKKNEFESMYFDQELQQLVLICKDCKDDKKDETTAWGFDPVTRKYTPSIISFNWKKMAEILDEDEIKFKPSSATLHPVTKNIWILSAINQLIAVTDKNGKLIHVFTLSPKIFSQPEGITFTPAGDLVISDEAGDNQGKGRLLFFIKKNTN